MHAIYTPPIPPAVDRRVSELCDYAKTEIQKGNRQPCRLLATTPHGHIEFRPEHLVFSHLREKFPSISRLILDSYSATAAAIICPVITRLPIPGRRCSKPRRKIIKEWGNWLGVIAESEDEARVEFYSIRMPRGDISFASLAQGRHAHPQRLLFAGFLPRQPATEEWKDAARRELYSMGLSLDVLTTGD